MLSLLLACSGQTPTTPPDATCDVTWEGFARPFLQTWCTPCHSTTVPVEDRHGAPPEVNFDTWDLAAPWADAIAAQAGSPDGPMPPAGGVRDADRANLAAWVACGAPGPETTPTDPCAGAERVHAGDLALDADPGATLDCLEEVDGSLVVGGAVATLALPRLVTVQGDLTLAASLAALDLPELTTVGGTVSLGGALPYQTTLVALAHAGALVLDGATGIGVLDLPRLTMVDGDLRVSGSPSLGSIVHTSDLEHVGGSLRITGNPSLGALRDFAYLTTIDGDLEIGGNGGIGLISGLWELTEVGGGLWIHDEPALTTIDGFDATAVGADLTIENDDALPQLGGLDGITAVGGDLVIRGNLAIDQADIDALLAVIGATVAGAVVAADNG